MLILGIVASKSVSNKSDAYKAGTDFSGSAGSKLYSSPDLCLFMLFSPAQAHEYSLESLRACSLKYTKLNFYI